MLASSVFLFSLPVSQRVVALMQPRRVGAAGPNIRVYSGLRESAGMRHGEKVSGRRYSSVL